MANANNPRGFWPIQSAVGAASNFEMVPCRILYSDTQAIYRGDPVKLTTTGGFCAAWTATTAVSQLMGIFWGCTYLSQSQGKQVESQIWPGADVAAAAQDSINGWLIPCTGSASPLFRVQSNATGTALNDIGGNVDVTMGTGSVITGWSGASLDMATIATTATLPFRIVGLYGGQIGAGGFGGIIPNDAGNPYGGSALGAYNQVLVRANVVGAGATGLA